MKLLRSLAALVVGVAASVLSLPAAPALAYTPSCSGSSCNGSWLSQTNCGDDPAAFAIANIWVVDFSAPRYDSLYYSPACDVYWGSDPNPADGYARTLQLWAQDQYGGREQSLFIGNFYPSDAAPASETPVYYIGNTKSIKFCYIWTGPPGPGSTGTAVPDDPSPGLATSSDPGTGVLTSNDPDTDAQTGFLTMANAKSTICTVWR